jgi:hypothetical protein
MPERVFDRGAQVADLAATIITGTGERKDVDRLRLEQGSNTVSQLDLAIGALSPA